MSAFGHAAAETDRPLLDAAFLERLEKLALEWRGRFAGLGGGSRSSRVRGAGQEFFEHRHFQPGDSLRAVNWRAYMRFERLFLKTFQLEPRVPVRVLLDVSASMAAGGADGLSQSKFEYARCLAAALTYIGLVQLDSILLQPFSDHLHAPELASGGRQRFAAAEKYLRALRVGGRTDFLAVAREFAARYPQRGLVVILSDFLEDSGALTPLEFIASSGNELMLVQLWTEEDRRPASDGEFELVDAESGNVLQIALDPASRQEYTHSFERHAAEVEKLALRRGGRYAGISTAMPLEAAIFGPLALERKA